MLKQRISFQILGAAAVLAICWTAHSAGEAEAQTPRFSHPRLISNPYLPLSSLKQDILESKTARIERTAKPEIRKVFKIGNQNVEALTIEDREFENGKLSEVTLDYFAQDDAGTVYYLGEDVDEYKNGAVVGHSGAWLLGKDTQRPGVLMPAHPAIGNKFKSEDVPRISTENDEVISLTETVVIPAGIFSNCVTVREKPSDGGTEYKFYAPGIGCVKEVESGAQYVLKSHEANPAH